MDGTRKLRTHSCEKDGNCQDTAERMEYIKDVFKKPEKNVLNIINSYVHNQIFNDQSGTKLAHDCRGYSALHLAAERNMVTVAEKLLESGFNPLTVGCSDSTFKLALHVAIEMEFDEMAALIIKHMEPADVRDLFCNKPQHFEFQMCRSKTLEETGDEYSVNFLIQRDCIFVKTIQAVFDSLKYVHDNRLCTVYVKLLVEDDNGLEPINEGFNAHYHTVFHNLTNAQKKLANHPVIAVLIDHKWEAGGKGKFVSAFMSYLMTLISITFAIVSGVMADDVRKYDTSLQHARGFCEIVICMLAIYRLVIEILQMKQQRLDYWKQFFNWIEFLFSSCICIVAFLRFTSENAHWFLLAFVYMLWILHIFKYAAVSSHTGAYAETLRQIVTNNFVPFSLLFIVINLAFSGVFLLVLKGEDRLNTHVETSTIYGIWFVGLRTLIEAGPIVEYSGYDGYGTASTIVMLVFMATTIVVLLNILIAQLGDTYSKIQDDAVKSVRVNRVLILTRQERNEMHTLSSLVAHRRWRWWFYPINSQRCCNILKMVKEILDKVFGLQSKRAEYYTSVLKNKDLYNKYKSYATQIEDMHEIILESKRAQIKTDLKTQTIKTRLRNLDEKIDNNFKDLLDKIKGQGRRNTL